MIGQCLRMIHGAVDPHCSSAYNIFSSLSDNILLHGLHTGIHTFQLQGEYLLLYHSGKAVCAIHYIPATTLTHKLSHHPYIRICVVCAYLFKPRFQAEFEMSQLGFVTDGK